MSLRFGREILAIPGPTTVPDRVLQAMHRPAIDIYEGELVGITDSIRADLRDVFRCDALPYIYIANGHGAWEASISNSMSAGDKALVLESGRFAIGWGEMASKLGVEIEVLNAPTRSAVDPAAVEARLRADTTAEIKAVLVVQIDTASGVVNDIPAIRAAIDAAGHPALFMVDCIASLGCMPFDMTGWGVDLAVAGCQKGLMTPPGLSYVAVGPKARLAHQTAGLVSHYWDWTARDGEIHYMKYCGTPPEHMLFAQRAALDMLKEEGLEATWARHAALARATQAAVSVWSRGGAFDFNVAAPDQRSQSVTTVRAMDDALPSRLRAFCREELGVVLGLGIGEDGAHQFRIAHMGHCNAAATLGVLSSIEAALTALSIPHEAGGVTAAAAEIASVLRPAPMAEALAS